MTFDAAFDWARRHVAAGHLPSAVLGVVSADGILALDAFSARTDDRYPLFSITKPLAGLTAARAVERGLITPQTPLADAVPGFGAKRDDVVRLRHLVSHTSGIAEPQLDTRDDLRAELVARGRDFAAGTATRYSTLAFTGVAAMIGHATGRSWEDELFDWASPVGATGLGFDVEAATPVVDAAAVGFDVAGFAAQRNPGAGLAGRALDLLNIGGSLLRTAAGATDGIVAPATLAMMRRPLTAGIPALDPYPVERGSDWGFTWNLRHAAPGLIDTDVFGHGGWAGTEFWIHPGAGLAWVLLTNRAERPGVDIDALDNAVVSGR